VTDPALSKIDDEHGEFRLRKAEYYPWVDVLRAVCFLMVFINHFGLGFGLWDYPQLSRAGVSLFFAISGWLITKIIVKTLAKPDFLAVFYSRRLLRIYPAYFITLGLYFVALPLVHEDTPRFLYHVPAFATFNFGLFAHHDVHLFSHSWSIATEERFYVIWPLVCAICARLKVPLVVPLALGLAVMTGSVLAIPQVNDVAWAPLLPPSLIYGCLLALYGDKIPRLDAVRTLIVMAAAFVGFLWVGTYAGSMYDPIASLFAVALVWCCATLPLKLPRTMAPAVRLGELSYGTYLLHRLPLYFVHKMGAKLHVPMWGWPVYFAIGLGLTVAAAHYLNVLVERRVLDFRFSLNERPRTTRVLATIQFLVLPLGLVLWLLVH
jgi:peptidoglycan/LPS O-acetylase OafA/YrhL